MNTKSTKALFLRHLIQHKKTIILLVIFALLASGFLPDRRSNSNKAVKNNLVSHAKLCCCGNIASACRDCCCSDDHAENDSTDGYTLAITACGGTSADILTVSKLSYFFSVSALINYMPVATLAETTLLQQVDILIEPPYKPPKPQLLINFT
jgi:hypothetical protein